MSILTYTQCLNKSEWYTFGEPFHFECSLLILGYSMNYCSQQLLINLDFVRLSLSKQDFPHTCFYSLNIFRMSVFGNNTSLYLKYPSSSIMQCAFNNMPSRGNKQDCTGNVTCTFYKAAMDNN